MLEPLPVAAAAEVEPALVVPALELLLELPQAATPRASAPALRRTVRDLGMW